MTLDPHLLERAREGADRLAEAERQVLVARGDYHTAVRRLHLAGGPLREIAQALSISHQRVQQIVTAAGGSWWMAWRRRGARAAVCSWCDRPPAEVSRLVAGPNVFICDECVTAAERAVRAADGRHRPLASTKRGSKSRCAFCSQRASDTRPLVTGPPNICDECLRACRGILEGRE